MDKCVDRDNVADIISSKVNFQGIEANEEVAHSKLKRN